MIKYNPGHVQVDDPMQSRRRPNKYCRQAEPHRLYLRYTYYKGRSLITSPTELINELSQVCKKPSFAV